MGIASIVSIINLLIALFSNALMRLGCQGEGTDDFSRLFSNLETIIVKATLVLGLLTHSYILIN